MKRVVWLILAMVCISSSSASDNIPPAEATTEISDKIELAYGKEQMAVANHSLATKAAQSILNQGGTAADAAIAASFVLGLVEPSSSGIGGGGYALSYNAKTKKVLAYDGREVSPKSATANWFLSESGTPMQFKAAMLSAKSVGVPGEVALLYKLHVDQGKLAWARLLQPAIDLANNGFPMGRRLHALLKMDHDGGILNDPDIQEVYFKEGKLRDVNTRVINRAYAATLKQIAKNPRDFYHGKIANDIVRSINAVAGKKLYTAADLQEYKVERHNGLCAWYRNNYQVCTVPPSSGGGVTLLELLKIYANNYKGTDLGDLDWVYNFAQASKLAFADRNQYLADPKFVKQPIYGLLDDNYIKLRGKLVSDEALETPVRAGIPQGIEKKYAPDLEPKVHGTSSVVVADKYGNAITMTISLEHQFGSRIFVDGFFLNGELADFAFVPNSKSGMPIANRVEAQKRPRSSMTPTIVFDKSKNMSLVTGSTGGSDIICYVAKYIIQALDFKLNIAEAIASPNLCAINGPLMLEAHTSLMSYKHKLASRGEVIGADYLEVSGGTSIARAESGGWFGASDPRKEGLALGN